MFQKLSKEIEHLEGLVSDYKGGGPLPHAFVVSSINRIIRISIDLANQGILDTDQPLSLVPLALDATDSCIDHSKNHEFSFLISNFIRRVKNIIS